MPQRVFAIDLGSTNTVVARADGEQVTILTVPGLSQTDEPLLPPLIPSQIYVRDAAAIDLLIGQQVRDAGLADVDEARLVTGFKRRIAAEIPGLDPELDGVEVTSQRAASWFLGAILRELPELDKNVDQVVFTVPVGSFQRYLAWLESFWPVRHWRVVDESTAAALGYDVPTGARVLTVISAAHDRPVAGRIPERSASPLSRCVGGDCQAARSSAGTTSTPGWSTTALPDWSGPRRMWPRTGAACAGRRSRPRYA